MDYLILKYDPLQLYHATKIFSTISRGSEIIASSSTRRLVILFYYVSGCLFPYSPSFLLAIGFNVRLI